MKEIWICRWEVIPGNGEQTQKFSTFAAAKQAMRRKIAENVDLKEYISNLDPKAAQFLNNYLSDPQFPRNETDVPEDYEEPELGELTLDAGFIIWDFPYKAHPRLDTTLVLTERDDCEYRFMFYYAYPQKATGSGVKELSITIAPYTDYGTSAYPLMVLLSLCENPRTQDQIVRNIAETWDTIIERKAVGRHLHLLQELGMPVQHGPDGYFYDGAQSAPKSGINFSPSAYPILVLQVLSNAHKTQAAIIREIQKKFGIKIDRKAVARHLALLKALGFDLKQ